MPSDTPPPLLTERTFKVRFQSLSEYNRDFAGRGTLSIDASSYSFRARQRGAYFTRKQDSLRFDRSQIRNVAVAGTKVQFATAVGKTGERHVPFVFWCGTHEEAAEIARLLPDTADEVGVEQAQFAAQLQIVSPITGPFASPTCWIIALNIATFAVMGVLGAGWLETASMKPYLEFAANNAAATTDGQWWRLLTSMFAHYGLLHLGLNMWALFEAGRLLERLLGRRLFVVSYLGSGITGGLASMLWHGDKVWSAGASGAVFGVYGALLGFLLHEKHALPRSVFRPLMTSAITFGGYNLFYGAIHPNIDNVAHLGGLLGGFIFGWLSAMPLDREARTQHVANRLRRAAAAICAIGVVGTIAAPRYDYRVSDELSWSDANTPYVEKESKLLKQMQGRIDAYAQNTSDPQLSDLLRREVIPVYEEWRRDIGQLQLSPGMRTDRRRTALAHVLEMKSTNLKHLLVASERHDPNALAVYVEEEKPVVSAIQEIRELK